VILERRERKRDRGMREGNRKREKERKSNRLFRLPTFSQFDLRVTKTLTDPTVEKMSHYLNSDWT
jgi:hypothetical protein